MAPAHRCFVNTDPVECIWIVFLSYANSLFLSRRARGCKYVFTQSAPMLFLPALDIWYFPIVQFDVFQFVQFCMNLECSPERPRFGCPGFYWSPVHFNIARSLAQIVFFHLYNLWPRNFDSWRPHAAYLFSQLNCLCNFKLVDINSLGWYSILHCVYTRMY